MLNNLLVTSDNFSDRTELKDSSSESKILAHKG